MTWLTDLKEKAELFPANPNRLMEVSAKRILALIEVVEVAKQIADGRPNTGGHVWMSLDDALSRLEELDDA